MHHILRSAARNIIILKKIEEVFTVGEKKVSSAATREIDHEG
jgi:hypothetical protein